MILSRREELNVLYAVFAVPKTSMTALKTGKAIKLLGVVRHASSKQRKISKRKLVQKSLKKN